MPPSLEGVAEAKLIIGALGCTEAAEEASRQDICPGSDTGSAAPSVPAGPAKSQTGNFAALRSAVARLPTPGGAVARPSNAANGDG